MVELLWPCWPKKKRTDEERTEAQRQARPIEGAATVIGRRSCRYTEVKGRQRSALPLPLRCVRSTRGAASFKLGLAWLRKTTTWRITHRKPREADAEVALLLRPCYNLKRGSIINTISYMTNVLQYCQSFSVLATQEVRNIHILFS